MSQFDDVGRFHRRFDLPVSRWCGASIPGARDPYPYRVPGIVDNATFLFRYQFLLEELGELLAAHRARDLPAIADALVDLVYVALGTAHYYGLPFDALFDAVQRTNLNKVKPRVDAESKRGSARLDVVKPPGWRPPDLAVVLRAAGWTP